MIRFYKRHLSPLKPPCCRFYPTCSSYAVEAIEKRGAFIGFFLTVWRILRCNPFCKGGYDPVPEKGESLRARKKRREPRAGDTAAAVEPGSAVLPLISPAAPAAEPDNLPGPLRPEDQTNIQER